MFRVLGFVSNSAPSSSPSSMASSYMDVPFTVRLPKDEYKTLSVMPFVFSFRVTVTSCSLLRGVPVVAEVFLFTCAQ